MPEDNYKGIREDQASTIIALLQEGNGLQKKILFTMEQMIKDQKTMHLQIMSYIKYEEARQQNISSTITMIERTSLKSISDKLSIIDSSLRSLYNRQY